MVVASMSWLFGRSINQAFITLGMRSEELQASKEELEATNEELRATEEELRASNEELEATNEELGAAEEESRAVSDELRLANHELRDTQERLVRSERLAAIGKVGSGVGHELRNPLGAIKNAVFFVRRKLSRTELPATEPRVMEFLGIIDGEVNAANKVISDLLSFSRVAKPTVTAVNVVDIIEDTLRRIEIPETVALSRAIDDNMLPVMVDADQIQQVFTNIISNALQAMPEGGRLDIQARRDGDMVAVEMADTGCGIPQTVMDKIFDPLFTTKAKGHRAGIIGVPQYPGTAWRWHPGR